MKNIIDNQLIFFNTDKTKNIAFRIEQLKKLKLVLQQNEKRLYNAIYKDFKKSEFDTYTTELALVFAQINESIKNVEKWSKTKRVKTNAINIPAASKVHPEPLGVALVIGAWNYPYLLTFSPAITAITAGCTVVLKPSELPFNTSNTITEVINNNFDADYFTAVEGSIAETSNLLAQKFDKIFFTGSEKVGRIVYQAAAKNLTPVTLELGGKSPAIITPSCNLKISAQRLVWGKFINSGQTCISPDYIVVHKSIKSKFITHIKAEIEKAHYSFNNHNYVQIINNEHFNRLISLIDKDKIILGGTSNKETRYIEPTVLDQVKFSDAVMQEEIFGPILPILDYEDLGQLLLKLKELPKPLAFYMFTENKEEERKALHQLSFGGGGINETVLHLANPNFAFGGVGSSGLGAYHGYEGFKAFSHLRSVLHKPTWFELKLKYYPRTALKLKIIKSLLKVPF